MKRILKLSVMLMVTCFFTMTSYADPLAEYSFGGTGLLTNSNYISNEYINEIVDIQGTVSLIMETPLIGPVCWQVAINIAGMEPMVFVLKDDNSGDCYNPYIDNVLINLQNGTCWGGGCPEDENKPGLVGSTNLNLFFKLSDLSGVISINGNNNSNPDDENPIAMNYNFLGNVTLDLTEK